MNFVQSAVYGSTLTQSNMKTQLFTVLLGAGLLFGSVQSVQAQENSEKYKVIQGLGYLHTQVALLLKKLGNPSLKRYSVG